MANPLAIMAIFAVLFLGFLAVNVLRVRRAERNAARPLSRTQMKEGLEIRLRQELASPVKDFTLIRSLRTRIAEMENTNG